MAEIQTSSSAAVPRSPLLQVKNLVTTFRTARGETRAVDGISFSIAQGQTVGLVGESGSGKSVTSLSLLRLIESPPGKIHSDSISFLGRNLLALSEREMRQVRGRDISIIFQEPMTSLNPVFTVGDQIAEVYRIHENLSRREAASRAVDMLHLVKIPSPQQRAKEYPHQLSGGMRQRVMIAMALACRPKLLIADEPTTALDVTIQAQILDLMASLQKELRMAVLLITHDLGVVAEVCDHVLVMYGGRVVEEAPVRRLFESPQHPYTEGLLRSIPRLGKKVKILPTIGGSVPPLGQFPPGCRFHTRCPKVMAICKTESPPPRHLGSGHQVCCWADGRPIPSVQESSASLH